VGAAAVDYLRICGHCVAYFCRMAKVALEKKDSGDPFYTAKLHTAASTSPSCCPKRPG